MWGLKYKRTFNTCTIQNWAVSSNSYIEVVNIEFIPVVMEKCNVSTLTSNWYYYLKNLGVEDSSFIKLSDLRVWDFYNRFQ